MSKLTNNHHGRMVGPLRHNPQPGLKLRTTRRSTRPQSVFFHGIYFSYDPGARARNGGCYLVAVVSTCASRVTKIEALASGLTRTQGTEPMVKSVQNPLEKLYDEFEEIEFQIESLSLLLIDITSPGMVAHEQSFDFIAAALHHQSKRLGATFEHMHRLWANSLTITQTKEGIIL